MCVSTHFPFFYSCDQCNGIDTDVFVPWGNRKQRLSIFAKEIDVLVDIAVGHMGKAASLSCPTTPNYQLTSGCDRVPFIIIAVKVKLS